MGTAAIQIAKLHKARVFTTAGTDAKMARGLELGADAAINHHTEDVPARVRALTGGRGVDIVIEHVGQATWDRSVKSLARCGRKWSGSAVISRGRRRRWRTCGASFAS